MNIFCSPFFRFLLTLFFLVLEQFLTILVYHCYDDGNVTRPVLHASYSSQLDFDHCRRALIMAAYRSNDCCHYLIGSMLLECKYCGIIGTGVSFSSNTADESIFQFFIIYWISLCAISSPLMRRRFETFQACLQVLHIKGIILQSICSTGRRGNMFQKNPKFKKRFGLRVYFGCTFATTLLGTSPNLQRPLTDPSASSCPE